MRCNGMLVYVSNLATLSRYFGRDLRNTGVGRSPRDDRRPRARARGGICKPLAAFSTGRCLGLGSGAVVNVIDPSHVYLSGEVTAAWDLIEGTVRAALAERVLTQSAGATPVVIVPPEQYPRLRGAAALIAARSFAQSMSA